MRNLALLSLFAAALPAQPQDPNLFVMHWEYNGPQYANLYKVRASDGTPGSNSVHHAASKGWLVPSSGMIDAIRLPSGKRQVFYARQHNTLVGFSLDVPYNGANEQLCGSVQLSEPYMILVGGRISPDGKFLYAIAGANPANTPSTVTQDYVYKVPLLDCPTGCIDKANVQKWPIPRIHAASVDIDPSGQWLAVAGYSATLLTVSTANGAVLSSTALMPNGATAFERNSVAINPVPVGSTRSVVVSSYGAKALRTIPCSLTGTACSPNPPGILTDVFPFYGPGAGAFHPSGKRYYWAQGSTNHTVSVINTSNPATLISMNVKKHVNLSAPGTTFASNALVAPNGLLYVSGPSLAPAKNYIAVFDVNGINASNPAPLAGITEFNSPPDPSMSMSVAGIGWARPVTGLPGCNGTGPNPNVQFSTSPAGLPFKVNSTNHTGNATYTTWTPGSTQQVIPQAVVAGPYNQRFQSHLEQYVFVNWTGINCAISGTTFTTPTANASCIANYKRQFRLTTQSSPNGFTTTPGSGFYDQGTTVTLTATPSSPYFIRYWHSDTSILSGVVQPGTPLSILMSSPRWAIPQIGVQVYDVHCWQTAPAALSGNTATIQVRCANFGTSPVTNLSLSLQGAPITVPVGSATVTFPVQLTGGLPANPTVTRNATIQVNNLPNGLIDLRLQVWAAHNNGGQLSTLHYSAP